MFFQDLDGCLEFFLLVICQMQLNDVFHAVFSDFDGNGSETVFYAVRTVKVNGAGEDLVFIMVNRADQLCCRRGDADSVQPFVVFSIYPSLWTLSRMTSLASI